MIRLPPRSTPLYSSAASDVYKRQDQLLGEQRAERRVAAQLYLRAILTRYGTRSETGCPSRAARWRKGWSAEEITVVVSTPDRTTAQKSSRAISRTWNNLP